MLKTWNPIKAMGIGEKEGYWKWLGEFLKAAASLQRIKAVLTSPILEFLVGFVGCGLFLFGGVMLGATDNGLYYLLALVSIPCILIALHGEYRDQMRRKG